jgi:hypothetical protein
MRDWHPEKRALWTPVSKGAVRHFNPHRYHLANEMQAAIPNQRTRKKAYFAQHLETVARPDNEFSFSRFFHHARHDRRKSRDRAATEIIAKSKTARQHDRIKSLQRRFLVPDVFSPQPGDSVNGRETILVAVRSRKLDHRELHFTTS